MRDHCITMTGSSGWIGPNVIGAGGRYSSDECGTTKTASVVGHPASGWSKDKG